MSAGPSRPSQVFPSPRPLLAALALLVGDLAFGALEGPGLEQYLEASRTRGGLQIDGALTEEAWTEAPAFVGFVQVHPVAGAPPSERTKVRVLYDERTLYVGFDCEDSRPQDIVATLSRRDADVVSDSVQVLIDPGHDHRTAFAFQVNAGNVQSDGVFYEEQLYSGDWDGVWSSATRITPTGWTAELAIPLHLLRFSDAREQTWGFGVRRVLARSNETIDSVLNPPSSNARISRLGHLRGVADVHPMGLELSPYAAARSVFRSAAPEAPRLKRFEPSADVGLDLRAQLTRQLSLQATVNPDFGQVEADQLILNLSTYETFFPETRPFFTQGLELFQAVGADNEGDASSPRVPQPLFYSRRVGQTAPILTAVKVAGKVGASTEIGVLDALVAQAPAPVEPEESLAPRLLVTPQRPLHLGARSELPAAPPSPTNYLAAVLRQPLGSLTRVGAMVTQVAPLPLRCDACALVEGASAASADFYVRSADGQYRFVGQVAGSQQTAGPAQRTLRDGTVLSRGDTGLGVYLRAGKVGGEGLRYEARYQLATPTLELNALGFMQTQNLHLATAVLGYARPDGLGALRGFSATLTTNGGWTADGESLLREQFTNLDVNVTLPSFDVIGVSGGAGPALFDVREATGLGMAVEQHPKAFANAYWSTNGARALSANGSFALGFHFPRGVYRWEVGWGGEVELAARPLPTLETRLSLGIDRTPHNPRFIRVREDGGLEFALLDSRYATATLRQQWMLSSRLSLQAYAQLFSAVGQFGERFTGQGPRVLLTELTPLGAEAREGFTENGFNMSIVMRWEHQLGSALYLVYTRTHRGAPAQGQVDLRVVPSPVALWDGPASGMLLAKWVYYFAA